MTLIQLEVPGKERVSRWANRPAAEPEIERVLAHYGFERVQAEPATPRLIVEDTESGEVEIFA